MNFKFEKQMLTLYGVTDRKNLGSVSLEAAVEAVLQGGVTMIQLREKALEDEAFIREAKKIKAVTDKYRVPLLINDNIKVCMDVDAAGVHVGQSDMEAGDVRALLGPDKILGVTAKTIDQAVAAWSAGADYIGSGAVFGTSTKADAKKMSLETLDEICHSVPIPVVAIGGIDAHNILKLKGHGMAGAAIVSGLFSADDFYGAAVKLRRLSEEIVNQSDCK